MGYSNTCEPSIRLLNRLKSLDTESQLDYDLIETAIYWARKYHGNQKRKTGEPYYTHPLEIAYMVAEYKLTTDVIVAAILHDIVEDTAITIDMIIDGFGNRIAEMVDRLTRDRSDGTKWSVQEVLENAYHLKDKEVILIKLADRIHNMYSINVKTPEKKTKTTTETFDFFIICAIYINNQEMEQTLYRLCFKSMYQECISYCEFDSVNNNSVLSSITESDNHQLVSRVFQNVKYLPKS